ncbi:hypothetical protein ACIP98_37860 [Streptomyces sp. NPDC088354]|uniref:hypothetical protein n=1 Tax=Streptomyces sp. NPDC088354 TaxID=3365856 RepID=UPI003807468B
MAELIREPGPDTVGADDHVRAAVADTFVHNLRLMHAHVPGKVDGDLLLFTAVLGKHEEHPSGDVWQAHTTGRVINADLQCVHYEMNSATALAQVGGVITSHLRRATSR